jgi:hypothetical protein
VNTSVVLGTATVFVTVAWGLAPSRLWWWAGWGGCALVGWLAGGAPPALGVALALQTAAMALLWTQLSADWMVEPTGARTPLILALGAGQLGASILAVDGPGLAWWPALALTMGGLSRLLLPGRPGQVIAAFALAGDIAVALGSGLDRTAIFVLLACPLALLFLWCRAAAAQRG